MHQDYRLLTDDEHEAIEKQTLRMIVQALQQYSKEAKEIFEVTPAPSKSEVIVLAEDLTQYALEVAEVYPINKRYAGFIDYKRVRWLPTPAGLFPQVLLVDAKASTENGRDTLQQSQLPMDAEYRKADGTVEQLRAGVFPHMVMASVTGQPLAAVTTSIFVHFYYRDLVDDPAGRIRELLDIYVLAVPHNRLKARYNPNPDATFFGAGKHSPARGEEPRIRVYFTRLRAACPWRLQQLTFAGSVNGYTLPLWRDIDAAGNETRDPFLYLSR
ncbi:SfiI family type II restriction endonuclease [Cellulomonas sp. zg-ZUI222]|uniref:SfiI family type II restriction endonuclease n=1 Tax=Cellulomonas wangleii TaxID=2816956 RepID=UPI001A93AE0D|nr:SfiI family type II restriction endonuclease [Cellulomonas wangleii]MBO0920367.1 SfiI family type II restriction endonuclease [Cellulomonas wangleii]